MPQCLWCKNTNLTREHLLPGWMRRIVDPQVHERTVTSWQPGFTERSILVKQGTPFTIRPRIVCQDCNGGWMSRLEERCKPFLEPMIRGSRHELDRHDCRTIASWAAKTAYVAESLHQPFSPREAREDFRADPLTPPIHLKVWLSQWAGGGGADIWTHPWYWSSDGSRQGNRLPNSHLTMLAVGHLVVIAAASPDPDFHAYGPRGMMRSHLVDAWPTESGSVRWPPPAPLDGTQMLELRRSFKRGLGEVNDP